MKVARKEIIEDILEISKTKRIIALVGMQGVGKSSLLEDIAFSLKNFKPPVRLVHAVHTEEDETNLLSQAKALGVGPSAFLIDDAEQYNNIISQLEIIIHKYSVVVFVTIRSVQQERHFRDRFSTYFESLYVNGLSYSEYIQYYSLTANSQNIVSYAQQGGSPSALCFNPESLSTHQKAATDSILLREIIEANLVRFPAHIRLLLEILSQHTGECLSSRDLCTAFSLKRVSVSPQTILDYLAMCKNALIVYSVQIFDITKEHCIEAGLAYYFADTGVSYSLQPTNKTNIYQGQKYSDTLIENLLFLLFKKQKWTIYQGKIDKKGHRKSEITFVLEKEGKRVYIQYIGRKESLAQVARKIDALLVIKDAWPKFTIGDERNEQNFKGIQHLCVGDVLTQSVII